MWKEILLIIGDGLSLIASALGIFYYFVIEKRVNAVNTNSIFMRIIFTSLLFFHIIHLIRNLAYPLVDQKPYINYISIEYVANLILNLTAQLIYYSFMGLEIPIWMNLLRNNTNNKNSSFKNFRNNLAGFLLKRGRTLIFSLMSISVLIALISVFLIPRLFLSNLIVMLGSLFINIPLTNICLIPITIHVISILIHSAISRPGENANLEIRKKIQVEALKIFSTNIVVLFYGWLWIVNMGPILLNTKFEDPGPKAYEAVYRLAPMDSIGSVALLLCWAGLIAGLIFLGTGETFNRLKSTIMVIDKKPAITATDMATKDFLSTKADPGKSLASREI